VSIALRSSIQFMVEANAQDFVGHAGRDRRRGGRAQCSRRDARDSGPLRSDTPGLSSHAPLLLVIVAKRIDPLQR
jgi:hypothetical protein